MAPDPNPEHLHPPQRLVVWSLLRAVGTIAALLTAYYLLPLDGSASLTATAALVLVLLVFVALGLWQVRSIIGAPYPGLRAATVLALLVPLFILLFAGYYYVLEQQVPSSFSGALTRTDSLYFTVTVLTTVGFGDIVARSEGARLAVTVQMIADLAVLGLLVRVAVHSVSRGVELRRAPTASPAAGDAADLGSAKDP